MKLKRVGPLSAGITAAIIYGLLGLFFGAIFSLVSMAGVALGGGDEPAWLGLLFGVGAIVVLPLFYGVMGGFVWMLGAAIYNLAARFTGGIEVDLSSD